MEQIMSVAAVAEMARAWYAGVRESLETPENVGKLVSVDVLTGNWALGDDTSLDAPLSLRVRNPTARIFTLRVGYSAVYGLGGVVERTAGI